MSQDFKARFEYFWSHGMISEESYHDIINECNFEDLASPNSYVPTSCNNAINETNGSIGNYTDLYDVILDVCNPSLVEQELRLKKRVFFFCLFHFFYFVFVIFFNYFFNEYYTN